VLGNSLRIERRQLKYGSDGEKAYAFLCSPLVGMSSTPNFARQEHDLRNFALMSRHMKEADNKP